MNLKAILVWLQVRDVVAVTNATICDIFLQPLSRGSSGPGLFLPPVRRVLRQFDDPGQRRYYRCQRQ